MHISLPNDVVHLLRTLVVAGYEAYIVGGAVRDIFQEKVVHDWDFATQATPEEIQKLFPESFYDNQFGTVGIPIEVKSENGSISPSVMSSGSNDSPSRAMSRELKVKSLEKTPTEKQFEIYEITTFRTEQGYSDRRRPDKVLWGKNLQEDLSRRDFTINAMALNVTRYKPSSRAVRPRAHCRGAQAEGVQDTRKKAELKIEAEIIDPFNGQKDLQDKIIRAVGNPETRFNEDALRMMRAIRLGAELGFSIEQQTLAAIKVNNRLITHISWERIRDEFIKIIASPFPADGMMMLYSTELLGQLVPELLEGVGLPQGGHHIYDVFTHAIESLRHCPSTDPIVRLATLLHDVGKPKAYQIRDEKPTFYNHEVIGARMVKDIANRFRLSVVQRDFLWKMVRWHMFPYDPKMTDAAVRRFVRRVSREDISNMMALRVGDRKGGGSRETSWRLEELKKRIENVLLDPLNVTDLAIDGNDVMEFLKIPPGPKVGEVLSALFEEVIEDPAKNTREYLLARINGVAISSAG